MVVLKLSAAGGLFAASSEIVNRGLNLHAVGGIVVASGVIVALVIATRIVSVTTADRLVRLAVVEVVIVRIMRVYID